MCVSFGSCTYACIYTCPQITDQLGVYQSAAVLGPLRLFHLSVNHSAGQRLVPEDTATTQAGGRVGTQAIESEWNQLRRFFRSQYVDTSILSTEVLQLYVDDFAYRRNNGILAIDQHHRAFGVVCRTLAEVCWQEELERVRNFRANRWGLQAVAAASAAAAQAALAAAGAAGQ